MQNDTTKHPLELRGGVWGAVAILSITLALLTLAAINRADIDGYTVAFLVPLLVAVVLVKDEKEYGEALIAGLSKPMFGIIALAVIFASIAGRIVSESGLIETLANMVVAAGIGGEYFPAVAFLLSSVVSLSTGTSVGTYFVVVPILFPAGVLVGADPAFVIGAIAAGGAFGDNLAPISDTTIASATTQEADIGGVVRSRLKYSLPVALVALLLYLSVSPSGQVPGTSQVGDMKPVTLLMLAVPAVIIVLCLMHKHLITALAGGSIVGGVVGVALGVLTPTQFLNFPGHFEIEGILPGSIESTLPTTAFLVVVFPFLGLMEASGILEKLANGISRLAAGPRSVETVTVLATGLLSMLTGVIAVAILAIGDVVKALGFKFRIDRYRRANLMDCAGIAFCFIVPWTVHAIVPAMLATASDPLKGGSPVTPIDVPMHNFYSWVMLGMVAFAIISGYGRTFFADSEAEMNEEERSSGTIP